MAEPTKIEGFTEAFPPASIPTLFTDGIANLSYSPRVVKFYLFRTDPSLKSVSDFLTQPSAQVVMPLEAFVASAVFFEKGVEQLKGLGLITDDQITAARALFPDAIS